MKKKWIILFLLLIIILIGYLIIIGFYPIAFVNRSPITLKKFQKVSEATVFYYQKASDIYNSGNNEIINSAEFKKEIERAMLDKLIENILINKELNNQLKSGEIKKIVNEKIKEVLLEKDIKKQVETLYNLSLNEFENELLEPQAKQEILEGRFLLNNINFEDWLKQTKNDSKVIILLNDFEWKNGQVEIKK
ncbi:hypothetical protein JW698_02340 [Candidatus Wolfebacteria bacterium]|nr:hypothetical protein [Candidatus Wolfebacteria bacterium]